MENPVSTKKTSEPYFDRELCDDVALHIALCKKKRKEQGKEYPYTYTIRFIRDAVRAQLKKERREILGEIAKD